MTLYVDRAYWGDPDCVTVGWLNTDGSRTFASGTKERPKPDLKPWKHGKRAVVLATWQENATELAQKAAERFSTWYRPHPAQKGYSGPWPVMGGPVEAVWERADIAIGTTSTALFGAVINGLPTIGRVGSVASTFEHIRRPDRAQWLHEMSYRQFHIDELETAWGLLCRLR